MNRYLFYFALSFSIGLTVFACKKIEQPDLSTVKDPCDCAKEVSADFVIEEVNAWGYLWEKSTETDTMYSKRSGRFTAIEDDASYIWYIGNEVLTTKEIVRYFNETIEGQNISVALVVKKDPNLICFPNDDGYDSVVKSFYVSEKKPVIDSSFMLEGTFRFKELNRQDSVDITFDFRKTLTNYFLIDVFNYDGMGTNSIGSWNNPQCNYRQVWFEIWNQKAMLHHKLNGEVQFEVEAEQLGNLPSYTYLGRKLN